MHLEHSGAETACPDFPEVGHVIFYCRKIL